MESSQPDGYLSVKTSTGLLQDQKLSDTAQGTVGSVNSGLKSAENLETAILGAAGPAADNVTEFKESFRERDGNDFTVLPDPNNMGLEKGKQYEMVVGRHPDEREVRE